jgi:hypothetical protein
MKKQAKIFIVLSLMIGNLKAQILQQLKPTANPAYMILGVAPTDIERPSTPKEFVSSFQNGIVNGKMAPNFALEITPYDLLPAYKNKRSYEDKAIDHVLGKQTLGRNLWNNLSLSMATSASDTMAIGQLKKGNGLGFGVKTILINGRPKAETYKALLGLNTKFAEELIYDDLINKIETSSKKLTRIELDLFVNELKATSDTSQKKILSIVQSSVKLDSARVQRKRYIIQKIMDDLDDKIKSTQNDSTRKAIVLAYLNERKKEVIKTQHGLLATANKKLAFAREGFIVDLSMAYMAHFEGNEWDAWHYAKFSGWTTLSYRWNLDTTFEKVSLLDAMVLVRYTGNDPKVDSTNYLDAGIKLQYTYNKITISSEAIYRKLNKIPSGVKTDFTYRATINLEYVLNERITLKTSIGRNFDGNSSAYDQPNGKIFAVGGLNFSILTGQ